jgi:hypothetical protein
MCPGWQTTVPCYRALRLKKLCALLLAASPGAHVQPRPAATRFTLGHSLHRSDPTEKNLRPKVASFLCHLGLLQLWGGPQSGLRME